jgi:hypothetical protein
MNTTHGAFQQAFAQALFAAPGAVDPEMQALVAQPAFAVYRNTVMKGCIDALQANFPAVARLVGEEWFRAAAAIHAAAEAPQNGRLLHYGQGFADFLRGFGPAAELGYLPGVAQLDAFWREAHAATDAPVADAGWVADRDLATLVLEPHPAARWAWFPDQPIFSIWDRNRRPDAADEELDWQGEGALLTRPHDAVQWQEIPHAGCVFLDACAEGAKLADAAEEALLADPGADLAATFGVLLRAGAFVGAQPSIDSTGRTS